MSEIIQQLKSLNVLVIGDYCIDHFSYGSCQRLSPEAPVPVFDIKYTNKMEGMAGNVFKNLQNLGLNVFLIKNEETVIKTRFVDLKTKQHLLRVDESNVIKKIDINNIKSFKYDAVVISDYDKGFITNDIIPNLLALFNCPIFVDSKKTDLSKYENCIIKINETEYGKVQKYPTNYKLIVTLGENGALYNNKIIPTNKVQVFDVSGAGDTFIASLVTKYLISNNLEKSIKFANICSSIVVTKSGTATINFEEIINEI